MMSGIERSSAVTRPRRTSGADRLALACEWALDVVAFAFLPVLTLVSRGTTPLVSVAGALALALALSAGRGRLYAPRMLQVLAGVTSALILWGLASSLWAVEPSRSVVTAARLAGLFAAGFALSLAAPLITAPARLFACLLAGLGVALALAEIQLATGGWLTRPFFVRPFIAPLLNQIENAIAILVLPMAAVLLARRHIAGAALLVFAATGIVYHLVGTAGQFAFAVAAGFAVLFYLLGRRVGAYAAALVCVAAILTAPSTFPRLASIPTVASHAAGMKFSATHRLMIWSFVGDRIAEKPVLGWGLDSSRSIPGGQQEVRPGARLLPLHPHNAALQVWLELGVVGAVLFAGFIGGIWFALANAPWPPLFTAAAAGGLVTALVAAMGSYGIWQEWWIATLWFAVFLVQLMGRLAVPILPIRGGAQPIV
jgi:O-antigen ligase